MGMLSAFLQRIQCWISFVFLFSVSLLLNLNFSSVSSSVTWASYWHEEKWSLEKYGVAELGSDSGVSGINAHTHLILFPSFSFFFYLPSLFILYSFFIFLPFFPFLSFPFLSFFHPPFSFFCLFLPPPLFPWLLLARILKQQVLLTGHEGMQTVRLFLSYNWWRARLLDFDFDLWQRTTY